MENNAPQMTTVNSQTEGKVYISLVQDPAFISAIQGLQEFVLDNNADIDMAYDWICDQAECSSFVADGPAWDLFYDMWDSTQGFDD
jgi:hypothetical protein